ncbi:hypothetical protein ACI6Q2_09905 [Chitinophagaceae bacterium LWZ2-11]
MITPHKEKMTTNVQVNFNKSQEITYWAKKYNISRELLQKIFKDADYSIPKMITALEAGRTQIS